MAELVTRIGSANVVDRSSSVAGQHGIEIAKRLGEIVSPARVLSRMIDRIAFAPDASFYRLVPLAIVQPDSIEEVRRLFAFSRERRIPLTFRAGGTSLSGQAITDGILVDISRYWRIARVEENGRSIRVQPGVIGQQANQLLKRFGKKIGPDPASIGVARLGGILSNNASGMCCGVSRNAYHTLRSMTFVLPSGTVIDTAAADAEAKFARFEPELHVGLLLLKRRVESDPHLAARIHAKYRSKNTVGYSLNAFLDFSSPVEIFSHLLIGGEGTLGFIAEAVLETVPDHPAKYTGLLLFRDLHSACGVIAPLREAGAAAIELMDRASLRSAEGKPGIPGILRALPADAAALLVEFQAPSDAELRELMPSADEAVASLGLLHPARLTSDPAEQEQLWKIRKGLFPSVGAVRASGTTVIIEDVAFPVDRLADAAADLTRLFRKHGYSEAILFGHAKDGNLHFVLAQGFNTPRQVARYRAFIEDVVQLVLHRYDGALKAEHGTGRNMAPFVETEWGPHAYAIMSDLKRLVDPENLLNPGVILNSNPEAHVKDLKHMPRVEPEVDKCMECGYCETICPSRDLTLTPRQRIVVRRELEHCREFGSSSALCDELARDFRYMALDTCAVDGLCAAACPVGIDTGTLTKHLRQVGHSPFARRIALSTARHFRLVEIGARLALYAGHTAQSMFGLHFMRAATQGVDVVSRALLREPFWRWSAEMPRPRKRSVPRRHDPYAEAVYFPTCISRIMGCLPEEPERSVMEALLAICSRAGIRLSVPADVSGHCCGMPFSSKGFEAAHRAAVNRTVESFFRWSREGALPIVLDNSPCSYGLKTARPFLTPENQARIDTLVILDSIEFVHDRLLASLPIRRKVDSVVLHPVCSALKMGLEAKLKGVCSAGSRRVFVPDDAGCCAFAGDRGFLLPELTASATLAEAAQVLTAVHDGYFSSSRTCEIGMTRATARTYRSYLHLLDFASAPPD
jgi:D-lactate dehydrogenase